MRVSLYACIYIYVFLRILYMTVVLSPPQTNATGTLYFHAQAMVL